MDNSVSKELKYINILNRIQKRFSTYEGFLILKNQYFTDNTFYYFLCVLFRFIHLIYFSGDYFNLMNANRNTNSTSFKQYIRYISCFSLFQQFVISYKIYLVINIIIIIIFIIRIIIIQFILARINNFKNTNKWHIPVNLHIIIDHCIFLLFPFLIEFLSFIYYMFFFPNKFIIKSENEIDPSKIIFLIINTILIILYNIENYFNIMCVNKIFTITNYDIYNILKDEKIYKPITYKYSNIVIYILIFFQNFAVFIPLENYINIRYKILFKIIVSIILFLVILLFLLVKKNNFNYTNFINSSINVIILFCYYSIIIDLIIYFTRYRIFDKLDDVIYSFLKLILSYITHLLFVMERKSFLKKKICEILFQEKNNIKEIIFINSFYYFHQIMLKIKIQKKIGQAFLLVKFLYNHINKCNKIGCNCKLFRLFLNKGNFDELKDYTSKLLLILNYLFESAFIDYNFYRSYDLSIILAEHYCHLKNNPIISFSIITTFMIKQNNRFNKIELFFLYELCQKYIYYISLMEYKDIDSQIINNNIELLSIQQRKDVLQEYYVILRKSYKVKRLINNYIDNEKKILKYKYIFEDSLSYQFDENNENIISIKINFFKEKMKIEDLYSFGKDKKKNYNLKKDRNEDTNLYIVIYLLKQEHSYYQKIINSIYKMDNIKKMPIFMIFKYFLFFEFFFGEKIPIEIGNKLYDFLTNKKSLFNGLIKKKDYILLKKKYKEENNKIDSKFYVIFEFKREIRTKYFSENAALKLGYKQKDIINEKIEILMPKIFFKAHQNAIKQLIIGNQIKYFLSKQSYFFGKSNTILYPAVYEITLIYNISKSLVIFIESKFLFDNKYSFMLDNNFELLANSRNFEDEYYLNQKILQAYNIGLIDILKLKKDKLKKKYENEFSQIKYQKFMKQIKTEEYFIPNLYTTSREKIFGNINQSQFNVSKNNIILQLITSKRKQETLDEIVKNENEDEEDDDEQKFFIKKDDIQKSLSDIFNTPRNIIIHKSYNKIMNKSTFIENIAKELTKIPENDLMLENDNTTYKLILHAKKLISKLLTKKELANNLIKITIKLSFLYDKIFYFITIDDEKKLFLNISKAIHFDNSQTKKIKNANSNDINRNNSLIKTKNTIPFNKKDKSRNKNILLNNKKYSSKNLNFENKKAKDSLNKSTNNENNNSINNNINILSNNNFLVIKTINEMKKKINKDKFISIIRIILSILLIFILIISIVIIIFQRFIINISGQILFTYYYNAHTRDTMLYLHSRLLLIYYDFYGLSPKLDISEENYDDSLIYLSELLKENHYAFWDYFFFYNRDIGNYSNVDLIYKKRKYKKISHYWEEIDYDFDFSSEIDVVLFKILSTDISDRNSKDIQEDLKNFLFFENNKKKVYSSFIRLLYYFCANYEFLYKKAFEEFEEATYESYKEYIKSQIIYYIFLEIFGFVFYIIFYASIHFYLSNTNDIIIKNIIFLFLYFGKEKKNNKSINNNYNNNKINLKLLEFEKIINDFDIERFEKYSNNLDNINSNKSINNDDKKTEEIIGKQNSKSINKKNSVKKKEKKEKENEKIINEQMIDRFLNSKNKEMNNSSSQNYLYDSNSQSIKDKLNNNSINASKDLLMNNNNSNFTNNYSNKNINKNTNIVQKDENLENEEKDNYQDLILNKSKKPFILLIKIYLIIIIILVLSIITFCVFKIQYTIKFNSKFGDFFTDFTLVTNRYSFLYYYFNTLRTLLIFPEDDRKKIFEKIMEGMEENYDILNKNYVSIISNNLSTYNEIIQFLIILIDSRNNLTNTIKEKICEEEEDCINYLNSKYNIFDSGIDLAYKSSINNIKNIFLDYQKLDNKYDIKKINSTIINSEESEFVKIELSLCHVFFYVQEKLYECLEKDVMNLQETFSKNMSLFNIITIIFSFFIFIFVIIFMFISIWQYSNSIKDSTYRINCSFYYIKQYSLTSYKQFDTTLSIL